MPRRAEPEEDYTTVEIPTNGGMHSGGDAAKIPSGFFRKIRNMLRKAGVWEKRPQLTYDNLTTIRYLAPWYDSATMTQRMTAWFGADSMDNGVYVKASSGETWSSKITFASSISALWVNIRDHANFIGQLVVATTGGSHEPVGLVAFNGTAITNDTTYAYEGTDALRLGNMQWFAPRSLAVLGERLFMASPLLTVANALGTNRSYSAASWTRTNVNTENVSVSGGGTIGRITPTATTGAQLDSNLAMAFASPAGVTCPNGMTLVWQAWFRGVSATYRMPLTLQILYREKWVTATAYTVGAVVVPTTPNDYRYRCTVAGTSGGGEPVWPTTIGNTVVDGGTLTWVCDASDVAGENNSVFIPTASAASTFSEYECVAEIAGAPNALKFDVRIKFGNASVGTITLAPIDFSFKDGLTDGNPRKRNYGQQVTRSDFRFPFFNQESSATATIDHGDYIYWTEIGELRIRAQNRHRLAGGIGEYAVIREIGGKIAAFKRNAAAVFGLVEDANTVVLPEGGLKSGFGCLHPRAIDVFEGYAYFIGEHEIYKWAPGMDTPEALCGDAMRDEIMDRASATWVESQIAHRNFPILTIDQRTRQMYVYTQKGKWYAMHVDDKSWTAHDSGGDTSVSPTGYELADIAYNMNTSNTLFSFATSGAGTAGVARLDSTQAAAKDQISSSGTLDVHAEMWLKPFELTGPRYEMLIDNVKVYHKATASQTGQTTTAYVSRDHGVTFPKSNQVTLAPVSTGGYRPMRISLFQSWGSLLLRILHSGNGGATSFNVSRMEADLQVLSGEYTKDLPTSGSSTL